MVPFAVFAVGGLFLAGFAWAGIATGQAEERQRHEARLGRGQIEQNQE